MKKVMSLFVAVVYVLAFSLTALAGPYYYSCNPFDYTGDGTPDIAVFQPSSGKWCIQGVTQFYYGSSGDIPVVGKYDTKFKGCYFIPYTTNFGVDCTWISFYHQTDVKEEVNNELDELIDKTGVNCIQLGMEIARMLGDVDTLPQPGGDIEDWANMTYINNMATFINYCDSKGIGVIFELCTNCWIPGFVRTENHIAVEKVDGESVCTTLTAAYTSQTYVTVDDAQYFMVNAPDDNIAWITTTDRQLKVSFGSIYTDNDAPPYYANDYLLDCTIDSANGTFPAGSKVALMNKWWPWPDADPWTEMTAWYDDVISFFESTVNDKSAILCWTMAGTYSLGGAEPSLWNSDIEDWVEEYVINTWDYFCSVGDQTDVGKGIAICPVYQDAYPYKRLSAFTNFSNWTAETGVEPDYVFITAKAGCDDTTFAGESDLMETFYFMLDYAYGPEGHKKMVVTDFGLQTYSSSNFSQPTDRAKRLEWGFDQADKYDAAGWWWWTYRDNVDSSGNPTTEWGIRVSTGEDWKEDRVNAIIADTRAADIAFFRPSGTYWNIRNITKVYYGLQTDIPAPADYDGDHTTDIAIYRDYQSKWAVRNQGIFYFGTSGDQPVPADYDGDGTYDKAYFRNTTGRWYIYGSTIYYYGTAGDVPVVADYDGDHTDDVAIFRPSTTKWAIRNVTVQYFGAQTDAPSPFDYEGDGTDNIAVFRDGAGMWAISTSLGTERVYYGSSGDIPVTR